jgi:hypothetical protein
MIATSKFLQGLTNDVQKVFPDAEHIFCVRHMIQNFQRVGHIGETLKMMFGLLQGQLASIPKYERSMDKLKVDSAGAYSWIEELVPTTWVNAFFSEFPKCDM